MIKKEYEKPTLNIISLGSGIHCLFDSTDEYLDDPFGEEPDSGNGE